MNTACPICDKHRGDGPLVGPVIFTDDLVTVSHRPLTQNPPLPGYLFVETTRHAPTFADLTDDEAAVVGWAARRAASALRAELAPESVFSAIAGRSIAHFHQHIFARPAGTPTETYWFDVDSWPDGPRIDDQGLADLVARLARHF
ncbi:HIT family protein [Nocardia sp. SSK8]|uniref:HIT family protein n=1 Tax=Nocardia sp. SSK8 TaxID=3120154 RepID=UPI00300ABBDA